MLPEKKAFSSDFWHLIKELESIWCMEDLSTTVQTTQAPLKFRLHLLKSLLVRQVLKRPVMRQIERQTSNVRGDRNDRPAKCMRNTRFIHDVCIPSG